MSDFLSRGRDINNHAVYGRFSDTIIDDAGKSVPVTDAALLIGYDKNGREIYTDDIVVDSHGNKFPATKFFFRVYTDLAVIT